MKKTLKILDCGYESGIDQNGISDGVKYNFTPSHGFFQEQKKPSELNLIELYVTNNIKIQNVNHMKKTLKKLYCCNESGIDQNGILELNLIELFMSGNEKIKNVNHMKKTQVASDGHKSSAC